MSGTNRLLSLIIRLQYETETDEARRLLLDYIRHSSSAQLAVMFAHNRQQKALLQVARSGRGPASTNKMRIARRQIPVDGLFADVLTRREPLYISSNDARLLPQERAWLWPDGHARLYILRTGSRANDNEGVLLLSYQPHKDDQPETFDESAVLICSTLLTSYLSDNNDKNEIQMRRRAESLSLDRARTTDAAQKIALLERERVRIARDLHDGVTQRLAHVLQKLEIIDCLLEKHQDESARLEIGCTRTHLLESLNELRRSIHILLPPQLEGRPLKEALNTLLDELRQNHPMTAVNAHIEAQVPLALEASIFRLIQEALNNVHKHAQATQVSVQIHSSKNLLLIEVSDNGIGFNGQGTGSIGLRSMRERVQEAGGAWELRSEPGAGTTIKARFPLHEDPPLLTKREHDVLRLMVEGLTNRHIAAQLSISRDTVKSHINHIMHKMHVHDRTQIAVIATRRGLL